MGGIISTGQDSFGNPLPRLKEGEHRDVAPSNPISVISVLVYALRQYLNYDSQERLPWLWDETLRPENSEDGNVPVEEEGSARKIVIEPGFNVEKSNRNYRPAIYVDRGTVRPIKMAVNNFVGTHFPSGLKAYHCLYNMDVVVECHSDVNNESCIIADTVGDYFLATRDVFRETLGFHELTEPVIGETRPNKTDNEYWITPVQFSVQYDKRWGTKPIAPIVREIAIKLRDAENPDDVYLELIKRDEGLP